MKVLRPIHKKLLTIVLCAYLAVVFTFLFSLNVWESSPGCFIKAAQDIGRSDKGKSSVPVFVDDLMYNRNTSNMIRPVLDPNKDVLLLKSLSRKVENASGDTSKQLNQRYHKQNQHGNVSTVFKAHTGEQQYTLGNDTPFDEMQQRIDKENTEVNELLLELEKNFPGLRNLQPDPVVEPYQELEQKEQRTDGAYTLFGRDAYVYSAYLDDRKQEDGTVFVRIIALLSQKAAIASIYSHANEGNPIVPVKCSKYEMCENHGRLFGGYIFSCPVQQTHFTQTDYLPSMYPSSTVSSRKSNFRSYNISAVLISLGKFAPQFKIPVFLTRPDASKIPFLDARPISGNLLLSSNDPSAGNRTKFRDFFIFRRQRDLSKERNQVSRTNLSFAVCVSPLFGHITTSKLVEFIELSRILGADHLYMYNFSIPAQVSEVLEYYSNLGVVTVLPFALPTGVRDSSVWYHGQLLANNDCLYRTMSQHDLVAFNDLDEFIVPHTDNALTWNEAFSDLLTPDRCGFSFKSAFFGSGYFLSRPGAGSRWVHQSIEDPDGRKFMTNITTRTRQFNKLRTKVMVCPWRVFEIGIHHISKQNREEWKPFLVDPALAFLHHYRRCSADGGMRCDLWENDSTIPFRYSEPLTYRYERIMNEVTSIFRSKNITDPRGIPRHKG
ncbi:upf0392 protein f13g3.3 [Plakobranchus ocellatus]|uniref:Upf0392 protein f13g3.3 n=1 Tax=Plakobranchus ocellatus TaxID=259542 RepID=A0AAV4C679_9GAST|nr:upf0392 protein f13g3.3 [Plakobranchus ocellatus]